jgi:hypothetical protein
VREDLRDYLRLLDADDDPEPPAAARDLFPDLERLAGVEDKV